MPYRRLDRGASERDTATMTDRNPKNWRTGVALALACVVGGGAGAQPPVGTLLLSDAEKAALLDRNTESSVATARSGIADRVAPDRAIHGVFGAEIGTRGTRSAFGAAAIPLGEHAGATVSFESSRTGGPR